MFTLTVCKSGSDSQRLFRHRLTLLYTFQGWLVVGEWCYQNLTDGDQEEGCSIKLLSYLLNV